MWYCIHPDYSVRKKFFDFARHLGFFGGHLLEFNSRSVVQSAWSLSIQTVFVRPSDIHIFKVDSILGLHSSHTKCEKSLRFA